MYAANTKKNPTGQGGASSNENFISHLSNINDSRKRQKIKNVANMLHFDFSRLPCIGSDIDYISWQAGGVIVADFKYRNSVMPTGQRRMYENIVDTLEKGGKRAVFAKVSHDRPANLIVDAASAEVTAWYSSGLWRTPSNGQPVRFDQWQRKYIEFLEGGEA